MRPTRNEKCPWCGANDEQITQELDTRELPAYDEDDAADTLPEQGVTE